MIKLKHVVVAGLFLLGGQAMAKDSLSVAVSPVPHAEILNHIKGKLAKDGLDLEIREFTDYIQPNTQVVEKHIDANYFQTKPFMDNYNEQHKTHLVAVGNIHIEPFGLYSKKIKSIKELKKGATLAMPNDPANEARSLLLLKDNGIIKLKEKEGELVNARDIIENPRDLKFKAIEAAMLPRVLPDVDAALINTNYALEAGLNPSKDALLIESKQSPYANFIAVNKENKDDPRVKKLVKALQSEDVKKFIEKKYQGAVVPAF